jgi:hypothetical protein
MTPALPTTHLYVAYTQQPHNGHRTTHISWTHPSTNRRYFSSTYISLPPLSLSLSLALLVILPSLFLGLAPTPGFGAVGGPGFGAAGGPGRDPSAPTTTSPLAPLDRVVSPVSGDDGMSCTITHKATSTLLLLALEPLGLKPKPTQSCGH